MEKREVMTVDGIKKMLKEKENEITDDFQIWLSIDEEGNGFFPMLKNTKYSLEIDPGNKRIVLFPINS